MRLFPRLHHTRVCRVFRKIRANQKLFGFIRSGVGKNLLILLCQKCKRAVQKDAVLFAQVNQLLIIAKYGIRVCQLFSALIS